MKKICVVEDFCANGLKVNFFYRNLWSSMCEGVGLEIERSMVQVLLLAQVLHYQVALSRC